MAPDGEILVAVSTPDLDGGSVHRHDPADPRGRRARRRVHHRATGLRPGALAGRSTRWCSPGRRNRAATALRDAATRWRAAHPHRPQARRRLAGVLAGRLPDRLSRCRSGVRPVRHRRQDQARGRAAPAHHPDVVPVRRQGFRDGQAGTDLRRRARRRGRRRIRSRPSRTGAGRPSFTPDGERLVYVRGTGATRSPPRSQRWPPTPPRPSENCSPRRPVTPATRWWPAITCCIRVWPSAGTTSRAGRWAVVGTAGRRHAAPTHRRGHRQPRRRRTGGGRRRGPGAGAGPRRGRAAIGAALR